MPTIVTLENGRIDVPKSENIIVKVSGWVKYRKNGEVHHIPPQECMRIEETDPNMKNGVTGTTEHPDSSVVYQNPHGRV